MFNKLIKCHEPSRGIEAEKCNECLNCFKSIKVVLESLRQHVENYSDEIPLNQKQGDNYSYFKVTDGNNKGKINVSCSNGGTGFLRMQKIQIVFEYLRCYNNKFGISPKDVIKACEIKGREPYATLKTYIGEINMMLRDIHCIEGKKTFINEDSEGINIKIP